MSPLSHKKTCFGLSLSVVLSTFILVPASLADERPRCNSAIPVDYTNERCIASTSLTAEGVEQETECKVRTGDTLYSIALCRGTTVERLAIVNDIADVNLIFIGQRLLIPERCEDSATHLCEGQFENQNIASRVVPSPSIDDRSSNVSIGVPGAERGPRTYDTNQSINVTAEISLPLVANDRNLGLVSAEVTLEDLVQVSTIDVRTVLGPLLVDDLNASLRELGGLFARPDQFDAFGIELEYNPRRLIIEAIVDPALLAPTILTADMVEEVLEDNILPDKFAAGITTNLRHSGIMGDASSARTNLSFDGFANIGGIGGVSALFGARATFGNEERLERSRIQLLKDDRRRLLRFTAGDISGSAPEQVGAFDFLGLAVERSYQDLRPTQNIRPNGRRSFVLERQSIVEVYVNGVLLDQFDAGPGPVELDGIVTQGATSRVSVVIEDDFGRREIDNFSISSDITLLQPGISEFAFGLGFLRDFDGQNFEYSDDLSGSFLLSRGLTDAATIRTFGVVAPNYQSASIGGVVAEFGGVFGSSIAFSNQSNGGNGYTIVADYLGGPFLGSSRNDSLTLNAGYFSEDFSPISSFNSNRTIKYEFSSDYRLNITSRTELGASLFATQQYDGEDWLISGAVSLSRSFSRVNLGISAFTQEAIDGTRDNSVFLFISAPFGSRFSGSASFNSLRERSRIDVRRRRGTRLPSLDYKVSVVNEPDETELNGRFGFENSRLRSDLDLRSRRKATQSDDLNTYSLSVQSGLAISGHGLAIGSDPGNGFYMFKRHPSLRGSRVAVTSASGSRVLGYANTFGPAVVPTSFAYRVRSLAVDVENPPVGYFLEGGTYDLFAGPLSGTSVIVGSDAFRSVLATIVTNGAPVSLAFGEFTNMDTGEKSSFFTNRDGRAAFNQLTPGNYRAEIASQNIYFDFSVTSDGPATVDLGVINAKANSQ